MMPRRGAERPAKTPKKTASSDEGGAECGAPHAPGAPSRLDDHDLCRIIDAWPDLPPAIRRAILAMVEAVATGSCKGG